MTDHIILRAAQQDGGCNMCSSIESGEKLCFFTFSLVFCTNNFAGNFQHEWMIKRPILPKLYDVEANSQNITWTVDHGPKIIFN